MKYKTIISVLIILILELYQPCFAQNNGDTKNPDTYSYTETIRNTVGWMACIAGGAITGAKAGTLILSEVSRRSSQYIFPCGEQLQLSSITRRIFDIELALHIEHFLLQGGAEASAGISGAIGGIIIVENLPAFVKQQYKLLFIPSADERQPHNTVSWRLIGGMAGFIIGQYVDVILRNAMVNQINDAQQRVIAHEGIVVRGVAYRVLMADAACAILGFLMVDGENAYVNFGMLLTILYFLWKRPYNEAGGNVDILEVD